MATVRKSHAVWSGDLKSGSGEVTLDSSGIGSYPVTWKARSEESGGLTSPEELIAAAHASCFSMALSNELGKAGHAPERIETAAEVDFVPGTGITTSKLRVTGKVPGISAEDFEAAAQGAGKNCPVSQALKGIKIEVTATLES
jgi:osmotically inducible protein OsmC